MIILFPFHEYTYYKKYWNTRAGRWNVILRGSSKARWMNYSRFLMCVHLKRILDPYEEVDHIDEDKTNDDISNLQILSKSENIAKKNKVDSVGKSIFICPTCKKEFERFKSNSHLGKASNANNTYCSKSCSSKVKAPIKHGTISAYSKRKCRCDLCHSAYRSYQNQQYYLRQTR